MSDTDKTIEMVKELWNVKPFDWERFSGAAGDSIMSIITAYEQSQKELEDYRERFASTMQLLRDEKADLDTAKKRIAELEKDKADTTETRKMTEALRVQLMKDGLWNYQEGDPHYYDLIEANTELLAALKPLVQKLKRPTADAIIHAHQVFNKHKGE